MADAAKLAIEITAQDKASRVMKGVGQSGSQMGSLLRKAAIGAAAGLASLGAGAVAMGIQSVRTYAQMGDEVQKMALRTKWSTESLSELRHVAEISGTELGAFEKSTRRMSKSISDASMGLATYLRDFEKLGLDVQSLRAMKPEEAFWAIANAIGNMDNEIEQSAVALNIFGRQGTQLFPMFAEGAEGIAKLRQEARDLGIVFTEDAANSAARLTDAMQKFQTSLKGVQIALAEKVVPSLTPFIEGLAQGVIAVTDFVKSNELLSRVLASAFGAYTAQENKMRDLRIQLIQETEKALQGEANERIKLLTQYKDAIKAMIDLHGWKGQELADQQAFVVAAEAEIAAYNQKVELARAAAEASAAHAARVKEETGALVATIARIYDMATAYKIAAAEKANMILLSERAYAESLREARASQLGLLQMHMQALTYGAELGMASEEYYKQQMGEYLKEYYAMITVPSYQHGGIVPGPVGQPVPIIAHGGERFAGAGKSIGDTNVYLTVQGSVVTERDLRDSMREAFIELKLSNTTTGF